MKFISLIILLCSYNFSFSDTDYPDPKTFTFSWQFEKLGIELFEKGQYDLALKMFNDAADIHKFHGSDRLYFHRGLTHAALDHHEKAVEDFNEGIKISPEFAPFYNSRGISYSELERYEEAMTDFNLAIELNSQYALPYGNRGLVHYALDNYEQAVEDLTKFRKLDKAQFTQGFKDILKLSKKKARERKGSLVQRCILYFRDRI